jgi:hypothetical protein
MQKNEASSGKKLNKEFQKNNQLNIDTYPTNKINYRSNIISKDAKTFDPSSTLPVFTMFKGFYNKKFNLTSYKNERENSRSRSRSPERRYEPHKIRGNGISEDALERIHYLGNIFKDSSFQKYYASRPPKRLSKFEEVCEYIINYRKNHSELESAMMAFYFVCHEIKYDSFYYKKNNNVNINNNQNKKTSFNAKNFQRPDLIYRKGKALSLGFTNLFEYILKRMEIKYKHLEGYCKLIPKNVKLNPYTSNLNQTINNNTSNIKIKINDNNAENNKKYKFHSPSNYNLSSSTKNLSNMIKSIKSTSNLFTERKKDEELPINHCWNAIYIKGEWYFVDTLFGSGGILDEKVELLRNPNEKRISEDSDIFFNPFYFMPLPKYLIMTHRPTEDNWQFVDKTITYNQFVNKNYPDIAQFYRGVYQYSVELLTHDYPIIDITSKQNLVIKLRLKKSVLQSDLYDITGKNKIGDIKYSFIEKKNIFIFEPIFPCNGDYIIKVNCRSLTSTDLVYWPLIDYIIRVHDVKSFSHFDKYKKKNLNINKNFIEKKDILTLPKLTNKNTQDIYQPKIINDYNNFFPSKVNKKICYDNDGFFLIEPKLTYLKKGSSIKFKVRIKGASVVAVLDGNHWFHLKKTEKETYEGERIIKSDNVSICCLRGRNIFTEVYRFKPIKEKSVDSKLFMFKLKNKSKIKK